MCKLFAGLCWGHGVGPHVVVDLGIVVKSVHLFEPVTANVNCIRSLSGPGWVFETMLITKDEEVLHMKWDSQREDCSIW